MPTFVYKARDVNGQLLSGEVTASAMAEAARLLRGEGRFIVDLEHKVERGGGERAFTFEQRARRIGRDDVIEFAQQMSVMLQTGVPIGEALLIAAEQSSNEHFAALLANIGDRVESGDSLSQALSRHPRVFPKVMVSLVRASEAVGGMGDMLERVSQYLAKERRIVKSVRGALMYPLFMFVMAVSVTVFLLLFVLPRFATIFASRGAALPLPTRVLMAVSDFGIHYWYVWSGAAAAMAGFFLWFRTRPAGRRCIDYLKLRLPVLRGIYRQLYVTRAMQTMGTLLNAGISMLDMIDLTRHVTHNVHYQDLWDKVHKSLCQGAQLSEPLSGSWLLPPSLPRMIRAGEKGGQLDRVVNRIAHFAEAEFDESVKRATQFIEPLMVIVMGLIIGAVAISMLLPIFTVGRALAG